MTGGARRESTNVDTAAGPTAPDELRHDPAVAERLHRRDALDAVRRCEALLRVHVDLRQLDRAGPGLDFLLEHGRKRMAGAAPLGPEVRDDRYLA